MVVSLPKHANIRPGTPVVKLPRICGHPPPRMERVDQPDLDVACKRKHIMKS